MSNMEKRYRNKIIIIIKFATQADWTGKQDSLLMWINPSPISPCSQYNQKQQPHLSLSLCAVLAILSPELEEPRESLSPLLPLSDPGPWCLPKLRRTRVGELSLDVVSGALLSMLAMPAHTSRHTQLKVSWTVFKYLPPPLPSSPPPPPPLDQTRPTTIYFKFY